MKKRNHYEKIKCGNGLHGMKYETNLISYYLLKAYKSNENFQLSNGKEGALKLDDIILESETFRIFAQAKHVDNEMKKITKDQLFGATGRYSLQVYLKVAYNEIFRKFLHDVQIQLDELFGNIQENTRDAEILKSTIIRLSKMLTEIITNFYDDSFKYLINNLQKLNNDKINGLLSSFQNTTFHLVTNISPNQDLSNFTRKGLLNLKYFEKNEVTGELFNFNTDKSFNTLSESVGKSQIPQWSIKIFLEKFYLIVITDNVLKENINHLYELLTSNLQIPHEITYNDVYEIIEEWQSKKTGIYLSRNEIDDAYFTNILSTTFKKQLKSYEEVIDFSIEPLLRNLNDRPISIVKTTRYLPIMTVLQKSLEDSAIIQTLFVNPFTELDKQKFQIKAFLHQKYTHLVCAFKLNDVGLIRFLGEIIEKLKENGKFLQYKKIILFSDDSVDINIGETEVFVDDQWYEKRYLNVNRTPICLGDMDSYYIPRVLSGINSKESEDEFLKNIVNNKEDFTLISDSPGMGKTSVLVSLAVKVNRSNNFWGILIRLNQFTELLEQHLESHTVPCLDEFINVSVISLFERQICQIPNILILMVDGFDEIYPDYANVVTQFLKNTCLMENVKTIIVTTRGHLKEYLQCILGVAAYELKPLTANNTCSLISKLWRQNLEIVENWYFSLPFRVHEILNIPLHVKIFAESFKYSDSELPITNWNINLYELYEVFINKTNEIFIKEKCNCQGNIYNKKVQNEKLQNLIEIYIQLALQKTFKSKVLKQLGVKRIDLNNFSEDCANSVLQYYQSSLGFVHETFKEFFVAKWVVRKIFSFEECYFNSKSLLRLLRIKYQENNYFAKWVAKKILNFSEPNLHILETILKDILLGNYGSRLFIDAYLEKNWNLLTDQILEIFGNVFNYHNYRIGLHQHYDCPNITRLMMEKCDNIPTANELYRTIINFETDLATDLILLLVRKGVNLSYKNWKGKSLLHLAAQKGNMELIKYSITVNIFEIDEVDEKGQTPLILALLANKWEISHYLISCGADINKLRTIKYNINKNTEVNCLHLAAYKGNLDLIKWIMSKNLCSIHEKTSHGWNVLHCAVQSRKFEVVKYLVSLNARIDDTTDSGHTLLDLAILNKDIVLAKYFFDLNLKTSGVTHSNQTTVPFD